jgi:hypothetical protein
MAMNVECVEFVVMAATEWERIWLWELAHVRRRTVARLRGDGGPFLLRRIYRSR